MDEVLYNTRHHIISRDIITSISLQGNNIVFPTFFMQLLSNINGQVVTAVNFIWQTNQPDCDKLSQSHQFLF